jgi:drug/metabolite transporter (DMT)-like permease
MKPSKNNPHQTARAPFQLSNESYGLLLLLISAILFSGMGCFLKLASNTSDNLPSTQLVFVRALFQGIFVVIGLCVRREENIEEQEENIYLKDAACSVVTGDELGKRLIFIPFGTNRREIQVVVARGVLGGCGFIMYFFSITVLPLGDAITLFSLYPVHTLLLAYFCLGEKIYWNHVFATLLSVVGAMFIAGPSYFSSSNNKNDADINYNYNPVGYITAFLGSIFGAFVITLIRKAGKLGVSTLQLLFSWSIFGCIFSILFHLIVQDSLEKNQPWHIPSLDDKVWLYIFGMCIIGSIAHFLLNYAGKMAPAGISSIVRSSDILFAYIWEVCIFGEIPTWSTIVGVVFVLSSLGVVAFQKWNDEQMKSGMEMENTISRTCSMDDDNGDENNGTEMLKLTRHMMEYERNDEEEVR